MIFPFIERRTGVMRFQKFLFLGSLCIFLAFASGCSQISNLPDTGAIKKWGVTIYKMGGKFYLFRSSAERDLHNAQKGFLSKCQKTPRAVAEQCILVFPTREWIVENLTTVWGGVVDRELIRDYIVAYMQSCINSGFTLIKKSGLFKDCRVVMARVGNGTNENLVPENAFEIRPEVIIQDGKKNRWYRLVSPNGKGSFLIGTLDFYNYCNNGWQKLAEKIEGLGKK